MQKRIKMIGCLIMITIKTKSFKFPNWKPEDDNIDKVSWLQKM